MTMTGLLSAEAILGMILNGTDPTSVYSTLGVSQGTSVAGTQLWIALHNDNPTDSALNEISTTNYNSYARTGINRSGSFTTPPGAEWVRTRYSRAATQRRSRGVR